uniref:Uncharacterized protein n=1 Tax=Arundo donax TaxID=35708 RepID=A0A0A9BR94_ARUDO
MPAPSAATWFHVTPTTNPPQVNSVTCTSNKGSPLRQSKLG